ncbi:hypothetical protein Bamy01_34830 [Bacillus amyloliquefaciens]|nr:hypothetical protein Bamy01_34830 [Bacillus amyloliquefaciens]
MGDNSRCTFIGSRYTYFYLLEYYDLVIDIREQYPLLSVEETIVIADESLKEFSGLFI